MKGYTSAFACAIALNVSGQSWSQELPSSGRMFATGLQDNGVLVCSFQSGSCTVSRLDAFGTPIWSQEFNPGLTAVWGPQEEENGDLLCCVQLVDPQDPTAQIDGIMRLSSSGSVIRVSALRSAPRDPANAYSSHLVLHQMDDEYHFVYLPSLGNNAKVYWMSADDEVLADFRVTGNYLPVMSMVELHGSLYGVGTGRIGKMAYNGAIQWLGQLAIGSTAHHMYEVLALNDQLLVRYQFNVGAERRPALARFDTTGVVLDDLVLDLAGTGIPDECFTVLQGPDILIGAYRYDQYDVMILRVDTAFDTWAGWTDDRPFSGLDGCRRAGTGIVLTGQNNQNGDRFISRSGPAGGFTACWTPLAVDTLLRQWPLINTISQAITDFDPLLEQVVVVPAPFAYISMSDCISLGGPSSSVHAAGPVVSVDGRMISIAMGDWTYVRSAVLLDATGRQVAIKSGPAATLAAVPLCAPGAGCYLLKLVSGEGAESVLRVVVAQ